jgi:glucuronosyltransferase
VDPAAHPKILGFVTHGGIYGIQESICHSVPLIVFPFFAEQDYNAVKIGSRGYGIPLDYTKVTEESFGNAIHEIIYNRKYD